MELPENVGLVVQSVTKEALTLQQLEVICFSQQNTSLMIAFGGSSCNGLHLSFFQCGQVLRNFYRVFHMARDGNGLLNGDITLGKLQLHLADGGKHHLIVGCHIQAGSNNLRKKGEQHNQTGCCQ